MSASQDTARSHARKRLALVVVGGIAGVAVGLAGIYGIGRLARNGGQDQACVPAVDMAKRLSPLMKGEVAALTPASAAKRLPNLAFKDATGQQKTLSDWKNRTILLNLWATWCVPCRKEMPALEALQDKLGGPDFEVVTVNIDTRDTEKPKAWLKDVHVEKLAYYADSSAKVFQDLKEIGKAFGMPTTILIDGAGCEVATLAGPATTRRVLVPAVGSAVNRISLGSWVAKIGANAATSDRLIDSTVKPICRAPAIAAGTGAMPCSRLRYMFSIITIASSTTKPTAIASAISDRLLIEKPSVHIPAHVPARRATSARSS